MMRPFRWHIFLRSPPKMHSEFVKTKMNAIAAHCQKLTVNGCGSGFNQVRLQELFPKSGPECLILIRNGERAGNEQRKRPPVKVALELVTTGDSSKCVCQRINPMRVEISGANGFQRGCACATFCDPFSATCAAGPRHNHVGFCGLGDNVVDHAFLLLHLSAPVCFVLGGALCIL